MEDKKKFVKKTLNYMSAVSKTEPVARVPVSASEIRKLDLSIKEKCKQNHYNDHNLENNQLYYTRTNDNPNEVIGCNSQKDTTGDDIIENFETLLECLQREQESYFLDTDNLDQQLMDDYTYNKLKKR